MNKEERMQSPRLKLTMKQYRELGGSSGLIEKYFRTVIQSSPNTNIAREILFVMGIEDRVKTRYHLKDLSDITFREENDVLKCIDHLVEGRIITQAHGRYALAHDYLAKHYNNLSGRIIDPVIRDNLAYSYAIFKEGMKTSFLADNEGIFSREYNKYLLFAIKVIMIGFFSFRLLSFNSFPLENSHELIGFPFAPWIGLPFIKYEVSAARNIDWHYLPILIVQCSWAFYVIELVNKIFIYVDDKPSMHLRSLGLVAMVIVGMVWTAFIPGVWLIWIGIIGACVGTKFLFLGRNIYKISGRNRYNIIGLYTMIKSIFVIYIGSVIYPYISWDLPRYKNFSVIQHILGLLSLSPSSSFISIYYVIIPLMIYFIYMYRAHVRTDSSVEFIGLYKQVEATY